MSQKTYLNLAISCQYSDSDEWQLIARFRSESEYWHGSTFWEIGSSATKESIFNYIKINDFRR